MHQIEAKDMNAGVSPAGGHPRRKSFALLRMISCRSGAAGLEFAFVVMPFMAVLFWTLNAALVFFAQQALQTATEQAARLVMTGQAQTSGLSVGQFQQAVCAGAPLFNCANLYVNIQTAASFSSATVTSPNQSGTFNGAGMSYSLGNSGDITEIIP